MRDIAVKAQSRTSQENFWEGLSYKLQQCAPFSLALGTQRALQQTKRGVRVQMTSVWGCAANSGLPGATSHWPCSWGKDETAFGVHYSPWSLVSASLYPKNLLQRIIHSLKWFSCGALYSLMTSAEQEFFIVILREESCE